MLIVLCGPYTPCVGDASGELTTDDLLEARLKISPMGVASGDIDARLSRSAKVISAGELSGDTDGRLDEGPFSRGVRGGDVSADGVVELASDVGTLPERTL